MDSAQIAELLRAFLAAPLSAEQLHDISMYIDLLLRWNARVNLTAVREPKEIVARHFGESLFAARQLFPSSSLDPMDTVIDIGSGAGFPGLPLKIWAPSLHVTLIESNQKKATFLREVIRNLMLTKAEVFAGRAEEFSGTAELIMLRAVEQFEVILSVARRLLAYNGRMALLIGETQVPQVRKVISDLHWRDALPIPQSSNRVLLIGVRDQTS